MKKLYEVTCIVDDQRKITYVVAPDAAKAASAVKEGEITNVRSFGECIVVSK
jgi:hypothetical protein